MSFFKKNPLLVLFLIVLVLVGLSLLVISLQTPKEIRTRAAETTQPVPFYRSYHAIGSDHFYTISAEEKDAAVPKGWAYEGIAGYIYKDPPTPISPQPPGNGVSLSLTVFLHGIGGSGDNQNPTGSSGSNKTPVHTTINAEGLIYNSTNHNQLVSTATGNITYNAANGNYTGTIQTPSSVPAGSYIIRIKVANHLVRLVPGTQTITLGQTLTLPAVTLVTGDAAVLPAGDNKLDILDYNMITDCYTSEIKPAINCADSTKKLASDLNDDGLVNLIDLNLYTRELSTQSGQ